jgi:phage baseplate assembly protein W
MARADKITQTQKIIETFSDFLTNFDKSPMTNDLGRITNESAIKTRVKNLVLTNLGERPFNSSIGSNVVRSLFEPYTSFTADDIKQSIKHTLKFNEPSIQVSSVDVIGDENQNNVRVNIVFYIINTQTSVSIDVILKRVR